MCSRVAGLMVWTVLLGVCQIGPGAQIPPWGSPEPLRAEILGTAEVPTLIEHAHVRAYLTHRGHPPSPARPCPTPSL